MLDQRERVDLLRPAVFEDLEVVARETRDEVALVVGDDDVDVDVVHLDLERDARRRPWILPLQSGRLENDCCRQEKKCANVVSWWIRLD